MKLQLQKLEDLRSNLNISYNLQTGLFDSEKNEHINCLYVNIRSLRGKLLDFYAFISSFKSTIHVIILSETWLYSQEKEFINLIGYNAFHSTSDYSRALGVSIFVIEDLLANVVHEDSSNYSNILIVQLSQLKINICGVYKNESNCDNDLFLNNLNFVLYKFKNCLVFGDFNLNLLDTANNNVSTYNNVIDTNGFIFLNKIS